MKKKEKNQFDEEKKAIKPPVRRFLPIHTGLIAYPVQ
jgi:hypothetical protein